MRKTKTITVFYFIRIIHLLSKETVYSKAETAVYATSAEKIVHKPKKINNSQYLVSLATRAST